ncbi:MAG: S8 family serine peptidase [Acidobacteria bacterium]|nr:S8 family serine peptidase [Acidobacteriota bacterium]
MTQGAFRSSDVDWRLCSMKVPRALFSVAIVAATVGMVAIASAQQPPAGPMIVVFDEDASFEDFRVVYSPDDRAAANPPAWNYLDPGVAGAVQVLERTHGFRADHVYSATIRGFAARLTTVQIAALQNDPRVSYIETDGTMRIVAQTLPWGIDRIDADVSSTAAGDGSGAITNVNAYIIDTGVDAKHQDLYVVGHVNFANGPNRDCHGHGTHVAGTVAARDNTVDVVGAAPGAPLTGVKVLGCGGTGSTSGVIKGIDWVTANAKKPAIANMSLGGGASQALDDAVRKSADSGVFYSIAAGNDGADACNYSPARAGTHGGVLTTAATDKDDNCRRRAEAARPPCPAPLWRPLMSAAPVRCTCRLTLWRAPPPWRDSSSSMPSSRARPARMAAPSRSCTPGSIKKV